jgi:hypothetical protein
MNTSRETVVCYGCNGIFAYEQYLVHLTGDYCSANYNYNKRGNSQNNGNYDENNGEYEGYLHSGYEGDIDENEEHDDNTNYRSIPRHLENPMYNNSPDTTTTFTNDIEDMMSGLTFGLGYIECYSCKICLDNEYMCPICLEKLNPGTYCTQMICGHSFCNSCCNKWFSSNCKCPLCNQNLTTLTG